MKKFFSGALAAFSAVAIAASGLAAPATAAPSYNPYPGQIHGMVAPGATVATGTFTSKDPNHTKIWYKTNKVAHAKASIVVVHGLAEHSGRYDYVTYRLNLAGFNVYRLDHRGHGMSAEPYNKVKKGNVDNFMYLVDDMLEVVKMARQENPGKKLFMLGHSMGAMATQTFETKYPTAVDATITNGGAILVNLYGPNTAPINTITPANLPAKNKELKGPTSGLQLEKILGQKTNIPDAVKQAGILDKGFTSPTVLQQAALPNKLGSGVCSDERIVEDYGKDPLNSSSFTVSTAAQILLSGIAFAQVHAKDYTRPTLIMHGAADGIVPLAGDISWYNAVGSHDKTMVVWEGLMHETMNEIARDQVIDYVINWFNKHL